MELGRPRVETAGGRVAPGAEFPANLRPGWIDSHCHILPTGLDLVKLNLKTAQTREEVLDMVREEAARGGEGWLQAVHYDQTKFPGARHVTRDELDAVCSDRPVLLRHSSGHASVANTAALEAAGVGPDTPDPSGGEHVRDESGRLTGVLLERAHEHVTNRAPLPSLEQMTEAILRAGELMASYGITCGTDMMTGRFDLSRELEAYRLASERGCAIRLRLALQWKEVLGSRAIEPGLLQDHVRAMDPDLCRVIGLKIFSDGALGSATAAIHGRYKTTGGQGKLIYAPERLSWIVAEAGRRGWPVIVHAIGDRAADHVMDAFEASGEPSRHRLEHAMILSDAQIERLARLGCPVSFQPEFLTFFGHAYRAQLPEDVWPRLKRMRSVIDAGIPVSFSTDRPIVEGIPEAGIEAAVNRPQGYDPSENVTLGEAEAAWTTGAALANGDEGLGGVLRAGSWADWRVVSASGETLETWRGGTRTWTKHTV